MAAVSALGPYVPRKPRLDRRNKDRRTPWTDAAVRTSPVLSVQRDVVGEHGVRAEVLQRRLLRMAFDVHDGPMQDLIAMGYGLNTLRTQVAAAIGGENVISLAPAFDDLVVQLAATERTLRSMMFSLEQNAASHIDLLAIVDEQTETFKRHSSVEVEVITEGDLELHTDSQRIAVERILQESLSNIAKHADADNVTIHLRGTGISLLLQIRDDGRGFDPNTSRRIGSTHIGLDAMRERLELLGGTLDIDSRHGGPTTITANINKWRPTEKAEPHYQATEIALSA
jgi:two-component system, NarL family, sensor histidine kinase DegS